MGGHYGSVQVRTTDRESVKAAAEAVAKEKSLHCLIGPELNGWVGIYPEGHGQDDSVGKAIAEKLDADVLHLLVHDDDVLAYWLWRQHQLVDSYWSKPGYFGEDNLADEERRVGNPEMFRPIIGDKANKLAALLDREAASAFEYERLDRLGKLLGIRNAVTAYEYLKEGERDGIKGWRQFEEIPASQVASEAQQRRAEINRIKALRTRLMQSGVLLYFDEAKEHGAAAMVCAGGDGLVVPKPNYMTRTLTIATLHRPWKSLEPAAIESPSHVTAVVCDAAANRIAFAAGDRVRIWDITNGAWSHLLDIPETDLAIGAAISPDGKLLAHASRNEIVLTEISTSRRLFAIGPRNQRQMAFHPSNDWLAAAGSPMGVVSIKDENHLREIYVGGKSRTPEFARAAMRRQLQKIDLEKFEKERKSMFDKQLKLLESQMGKAGMSKEKLDKAREMMEKSVQAFADQIKAAKSGDDSGIPAIPATANELVMCVGFTQDGRWLYCGTNAGLRVYDWQTFPRETGSDAPAPAWQFSPPGSGERDHNRQINAIVEDPSGPGLVFAGWSGDLFRLDLRTGEVRKLISVPGGGGVWSMALSKSGEVLAVSSQFSGRLTKQTLLPDSRAFEVWDFKQLCELSPPTTTAPLEKSEQNSGGLL